MSHEVSPDQKVPPPRRFVLPFLALKLKSVAAFSL